ncbi:hypothetical protein [Brevundimonas nasdae]|uniref:Uncharacterized protein n=1 Tax=Brevundimonas nasdae TaxID=172043 RepID=A0ABX8THF5_9CAUL|nr:hypothetical protein [Brevundimonas nasdae]QYC10666.1 hypothetical protein KWG56_01195 [Brevundimonas nasdae]QYC13453.1 hypothetical protein KWG63_14750 [Brevundimonas nasdae]
MAPVRPWTNLLDPEFAKGLAEHAARTAERYSWVMDWTPVNEPLTTARFSALYGHWHPHRRDERDFWVALLNQIDATRLSMQAIRAVIPQARLIQTEDFGVTFGTEVWASQIRFENDRRLMTWDLLFGRVVEGHSLYDHLFRLSLGDRLDEIANDPCRPDVIGLNHYVTSDRFLDHRLERYPQASHGGNGSLAYADVEAVRALHGGQGGWRERLRSLWDRYGATLAVTECHLGADPADQVLWFEACWRDAQTLIEEGLDIEAVTAWSLLGAVDWDSLLTRREGRYEPGVFDVSTGQPVAGLLAERLRAVSCEGAGTVSTPGGGGSRDDRRCFFPEVDDPPRGWAA